MYLVVLIVFLLIIFNTKKKRTAPQHPEQYILSPVDGYISSISNLSIDNYNYIEIVIDFSLLNKNMYAPMKGKISRVQERSVLTLLLTGQNKVEMEISHYPYQFIDNMLNIMKRIDLYEANSLRMSENYGFFYFGNYIKLIIKDNENLELIASAKQSVIGGESILLKVRKNNEHFIR